MSQMLNYLISTRGTTPSVIYRFFEWNFIKNRLIGFINRLFQKKITDCKSTIYIADY